MGCLLASSSSTPPTVSDIIAAWPNETNQMQRVIGYFVSTTIREYNKEKLLTVKCTKCDAEETRPKNDADKQASLTEAGPESCVNSAMGGQICSGTILNKKKDMIEQATALWYGGYGLDEDDIIRFVKRMEDVPFASRQAAETSSAAPTV